MGLFPRLLVAGVPLHPGQGKACLLQPFLNGYAIAGIYLAGAGAAANRAAHAAAISSKGAGLFQWEIAVLFQQHGAAC